MSDRIETVCAACGGTIFVRLSDQSPSYHSNVRDCLVKMGDDIDALREELHAAKEELAKGIRQAKNWANAAAYGI